VHTKALVDMQTRLGAALALVDRQSRCTTSCCRPSSGTAQAAVEQIRPGKAQADAGQTPPGTVQTAVL
jgi:hypothetical protein